MLRELIATRRAFTLDKVLSAEECAAFIAQAEAVGFTEAPVTTARGFVQMPELRNNRRVILDDEALAATIWARLRAWFAEEGGVRPVGLNERFRVYRYDPGQFFGAHRDGWYHRPGTCERSVYTVLLYLNDDFDGGETTFVAHHRAARPQTVRALCFVHPLLHEGSTVRRGRKYVLRTDVMFEIPGLS